MKLWITPYKWDADAVDYLTSKNEICEVEEDPIEPLSDVENLKQGECSSGPELADRLSNFYTERELLSDSQEEEDIAIFNASSTN